MSNRDPDARYEREDEAIPWYVEQWVRLHINTSLPGVVRKYDPETRRAQVQPAIRRLLAPQPLPNGSPNPDQSPVQMDKQPILDVPVIHPAGGGWNVHLPLQPGDPVWLAFSARGLDEFKRTFALSNPPLGVFFEERDAVAFPGFGALAITPASTTGLSIQSDDGATAIVMTPGSVDIRSASLTHNGVNIGDDHDHGGIASGPGRTTGPG